MNSTIFRLHSGLVTVLLSFCCVLLALPASLTAQSTPQSEETDRITGASGGSPEVKYSLKSRHDAGVRHVYKYTEVTNVNRVYNDEDSTKIKYSRRMTYYLTGFLPQDATKGSKTFYVNIDSMYFEFDNFQSEFLEYNSQTQEADLNHPEIMAASVLMNRPVYMTYSPYGEIIDYQSDELDYLKDYLNDGGDTVLPALDYFLWWDRMDKKSIGQIMDIPRNLIPETFIKPDTSWQRPVEMVYDGILLKDTATLKIREFTDGIYEIDGRASNIQISPNQKTYMYGHPEFCYIKTGEGQAKYHVRFNRLGVLGSVNTKVNAEFTVDAQPFSFSQTIETDNTIELMGRWQW